MTRTNKHIKKVDSIVYNREYLGNIQELAIFVAILYIKIPRIYLQASLLAQMVKNLLSLPMQKTWVRYLCQKVPWEMTIHSSILAWRILWPEEPVGLQSMGSQKVGHEWLTLFIWRIYLKLTQDCKSTILQYIFLKYQEKLSVIYNIFITCLLIHSQDLLEHVINVKRYEVNLPDPGEKCALTLEQ